MAGGDSHITKHHTKAHDGGHHHTTGHAHFNAAELQGHHAHTHTGETAKAHDKDEKHLTFSPAHKAFAKDEHHDKDAKAVKAVASAKHEGGHDKPKVAATKPEHAKPETKTATAKTDSHDKAHVAKTDAASVHLAKATPAEIDLAKHKGLRQADAAAADGKGAVNPGHAVIDGAPKPGAEKPKTLEMPPVKIESVGVSKREKETVALASAGAKDAKPAAEKTIVSPGAEKLAAGEKPSINVQFGDKASEAAGNGKPYTFRVDGHGKVLDSQGQEVTKKIGFDHGVPKDIVIKVDKLDNADKMNADQQRAAAANQQEHLNDFVRNTLNPALRAAAPEVATTGISVQDSTKSLRPEAMQELAQATPKEAPLPPAEKPVVAPQTHYSAPEQHAYHHMNGRHGMQNGHHGEMPREHADKFFPQGTPKMANETTDSAARRDTLAAAFNPDKADPYGTTRLQGDHHSYAVGRYGQSYNNFNNLMHHALGQAMHHWSPSVLAEMTDKDGNIDWSKLNDVLKEHPELMTDVQDSVKQAGLPDALASKFADADHLGQFGNFVQKLRGDNGPVNKEDLAKNFGKDAQDAMAQQTVDRGTRSGKTGAETALAQHLGVEPDQLTDAQKSDPANKEFLEAATKFEALANARENPGQFGDKRSYDKFDWSANGDGTQARASADLNPQSAHSMAQWAQQWAKTNETVDPQTGTGNCTRLWRRAIEKVTGHDIGSMSGVGQTQYIAKLAKEGYFRRVSESEVQEGDFIGRGWSAGVISQHGGRNLGDSAMAAGRSGNTIYAVNGAAHNAFVANNHSSRYTENVYFRPTEKFTQLFKDGQENA